MNWNIFNPKRKDNPNESDTEDKSTAKEPERIMEQHRENNGTDNFSYGTSARPNAGGNSTLTAIEALDSVKEYINSLERELATLMRDNQDKSDEIKDLKVDVKRAENNLERYKDKITAYQVMSAIIEPITKIKNMVLSSNDLTTLKSDIDKLYLNLFSAFSSAGVSVFGANIGEQAPEETDGIVKFKLSYIDTADPQKHLEIASVKSFGCAIRGESGYIQGEAVVYRFDEAAMPKREETHQNSEIKTDDSLRDHEFIQKERIYPELTDKPRDVKLGSDRTSEQYPAHPGVNQTITIPANIEITNTSKDVLYVLYERGVVPLNEEREIIFSNDHRIDPIGEYNIVFGGKVYNEPLGEDLSHASAKIIKEDGRTKLCIINKYREIRIPLK